MVTLTTARLADDPPHLIIAAMQSTVPCRRFGRTGLAMPVLTLGAMRFQYAWKDVEWSEIPAASQQNLERTVLHALDLGMYHIETARGYGTSERQLGRQGRVRPRGRGSEDGSAAGGCPRPSVADRLRRLRRHFPLIAVVVAFFVRVVVVIVVGVFLGLRGFELAGEVGRAFLGLSPQVLLAFQLLAQLVHFLIVAPVGARDGRDGGQVSRAQQVREIPGHESHSSFSYRLVKKAAKASSGGITASARPAARPCSPR